MPDAAALRLYWLRETSSICSRPLSTQQSSTEIGSKGTRHVTGVSTETIFEM